MIRTLEHDTTTPDVETSSDDYARRFAGPVGKYFLDVQARAVTRLLGQVADAPARILEVGGGHGQLTGVLTDAGHSVVVQGSRPVCANRLRRATGPVTPFAVSSLWSLPFADRSFDAVIAVRVLAHVEMWEELIGEMTRVARQAIIVDYPSLLSANLLTPVLFRIKRRIEGNTRPYFCYTTRSIAGCIRRCGFEPATVYKQFALPMGLHRVLSRPRFADAVESACRSVGLTACLGSPALMLARRRQS